MLYTVSLYLREWMERVRECLVDDNNVSVWSHAYKKPECKSRFVIVWDLSIHCWISREKKVARLGLIDLFHLIWGCRIEDKYTGKQKCPLERLVCILYRVQRFTDHLHEHNFSYFSMEWSFQKSCYNNYFPNKVSRWNTLVNAFVSFLGSRCLCLCNGITCVFIWITFHARRSHIVSTYERLELRRNVNLHNHSTEISTQKPYSRFGRIKGAFRRAVSRDVVYISTPTYGFGKRDEHKPLPTVWLEFQSRASGVVSPC